MDAPISILKSPGGGTRKTETVRIKNATPGHSRNITLGNQMMSSLGSSEITFQICGRSMANQDIFPSNVHTENLPPSREMPTLNDNSYKSKERNPQFIIKNANPNILIPISPSETGPKRILRPTPRSSIKKWNQLNIKQYDSREAFIKVSP